MGIGVSPPYRVVLIGCAAHSRHTRKKKQQAFLPVAYVSVRPSANPGIRWGDANYERDFGPPRTWVLIFIYSPPSFPL